MKGHKSQGEARLMALEEHSFRHLLLTFLISQGTQVVLKADKPLQDGSGAAAVPRGVLWR